MTEKKQKKILCAGEILWDMLPTGSKAGGAPMNVALHLKKFGFDSKFAGRVGNDRLGQSLKDFLINKGMNTDLIQTDPSFPTSTVEVVLGPNHEVKFDIVDNVAWDRMELTTALRKSAEESDVLIYGSLASRHSITRDTILTMLDNECLKLMDVNFRPPFVDKEVIEQLLVKADIVKLNDDELKVVGGWHAVDGSVDRITTWFAKKYGNRIVCITRGANGALIYDQSELIEHAGYKVNVVDTVGSGDAFLAGFLAKYLDNRPLSEALDYACATGALVATKAGGTPHYELSEISDIITNG